MLVLSRNDNSKISVSPRAATVSDPSSPKQRPYYILKIFAASEFPIAFFRLKHTKKGTLTGGLLPKKSVNSRYATGFFAVAP